MSIMRFPQYIAAQATVIVTLLADDSSKRTGNRLRSDSMHSPSRKTYATAVAHLQAARTWTPDTAS